MDHPKLRAASRPGSDRRCPAMVYRVEPDIKRLDLFGAAVRLGRARPKRDCGEAEMTNHNPATTIRTADDLRKRMLAGEILHSFIPPGSRRHAWRLEPSQAHVAHEAVADLRREVPTTTTLEVA